MDFNPNPNPRRLLLHLLTPFNIFQLSAGRKGSSRSLVSQWICKLAIWSGIYTARRRLCWHTHFQLDLFCSLSHDLCHVRLQGGGEQAWCCTFLLPFGEVSNMRSGAVVRWVRCFSFPPHLHAEQSSVMVSADLSLLMSPDGGSSAKSWHWFSVNLSYFDPRCRPWAVKLHNTPTEPAHSVVLFVVRLSRESDETDVISNRLHSNWLTSGPSW